MSFSRFANYLSLSLLALILLFPAFISLGYSGNFSGAFLSDFSQLDFSLKKWLALLTSAKNADALNYLPAAALRLLALASLFLSALANKRWPQHLNKIYSYIAVFLAIGLASLLYNHSSYDASCSWVNWLSCACAFTATTIIAYNCQSSALFRIIIVTQKLSLLLVIAATWYLFLHPSTHSATMMGAYSNQNMLAAWLLLPLPLLVIQGLGNSAQNKTDALSLVLLGSDMLTIYMCFNRTSWALASLIALAALLLDNRDSWKQAVLKIAFSGLAVLMLLGASVLNLKGHSTLAILSIIAGVALLIELFRKIPHFRQRAFWGKCLSLLLALVLTSIALNFIADSSADLASQRMQQLAQGNDSSGLARLEFFRSSAAIALAHPLLGAGPQSFAYLYPQYQHDARWFSRYSHCQALDILSDYGFPALLIAMMALACGLRLAVRGWRNGDSEYTTWYLGLILGLLGFAVHAQVDVDGQCLALMLTTSILAGLLVGKTDRTEESPNSCAPLRYGLAAAAFLLLLPLVYSTPGEYSRAYAEYCSEHTHKEQAEQLWLRAVSINPYDSESHRLLALLYMELLFEHNLSGTHESIDQHSALAVKYDNRPACYTMRGRSLELDDRFAEAEEAYRTALRLDPFNQSCIYDDLGRLLLRQKRYPEAQACLEELIALFPPETLRQMLPRRQQEVKDSLLYAYGRLLPLIQDESQRQRYIASQREIESIVSDSNGLKF